MIRCGTYAERRRPRSRRKIKRNPTLFCIVDDAEVVDTLTPYRITLGVVVCILTILSAFFPCKPLTVTVNAVRPPPPVPASYRFPI